MTRCLFRPAVATVFALAAAAAAVPNPVPPKATTAAIALDREPIESLQTAVVGSR